jgi:SAM-dependent methyltransferase
MNEDRDTLAANFWDQRYDTDDFVFGEAPNAFLQRAAARLPVDGRVLCVADGEGRNSVYLARLGYDVYAVDISAVGVAKARRLADRYDVRATFEVADLAHWSWPEAAYDAIVAIFIQFAAPAVRAQLFERMKTALKPGGTLLLHGYTPEQIALGTGGPACAENMYDETMLGAAFSDFHIACLSSYTANLFEGRGHHGPSALIDLIARKPGGGPL